MKHKKLPQQRIAVDIPAEMYVTVKKKSLDRNMSIKQWFIEAILNKFRRELEERI